MSMLFGGGCRRCRNLVVSLWPLYSIGSVPGIRFSQVYVTDVV